MNGSGRRLTLQKWRHRRKGLRRLPSDTLKRPDGTRKVRISFPGNKLPGYYQPSLTGLGVVETLNSTIMSEKQGELDIYLRIIAIFKLT